MQAAQDFLLVNVTRESIYGYLLTIPIMGDSEPWEADRNRAPNAGLGVRAIYGRLEVGGPAGRDASDRPARKPAALPARCRRSGRLEADFCRIN